MNDRKKRINLNINKEKYVNIKKLTMIVTHLEEKSST